MNRLNFVILSGGLLVIQKASIMFLSPFLDAIGMSVSTVMSSYSQGLYRHLPYLRGYLPRGFISIFFFCSRSAWHTSSFRHFLEVFLSVHPHLAWLLQTNTWCHFPSWRSDQSMYPDPTFESAFKILASSHTLSLKFRIWMPLLTPSPAIQLQKKADSF